MTRIVEFDSVYLEYPDELEKEEETEELASDEEAVQEYEDMVMSRTQKLSLEELQQKLEETQSLHL